MFVSVSIFAAKQDVRISAFAPQILGRFLDSAWLFPDFLDSSPPSPAFHACGLLAVVVGSLFEREQDPPAAFAVTRWEPSKYCAGAAILDPAWLCVISGEKNTNTHTHTPCDSAKEAMGQLGPQLIFLLTTGVVERLF